MASEHGPHLFERGFLATDMVDRGVVFIGSPGDVELAAGDDFVFISFLAQRGEGQSTEREREERE